MLRQRADQQQPGARVTNKQSETVARGQGGGEGSEGVHQKLGGHHPRHPLGKGRHPLPPPEHLRDSMKKKKNIKIIN